MTDNIVSIEDITVVFDGFKAVNGLSLNVRHNELRVVIGPNGAGKTTLLDIICGKTKPRQGRVMFKGTDLTRLEEHQIVRLGVARKFQTPSVYEDLSVRENFEVSLPEGRSVWGSLLFRRDATVAKRIAEVASWVFLDSVLRTKAKHLSHGQKQWLEIGMMLIQDPALLLLDEPVAGMSHKEREQTAELLKRIARGKSIVVIEHDMEFVRSIAHTVTVMHQGSVLCEGSIDEVQRNQRVIEVYLGA
ncbi:urea ABC transporter ATP-binding protein UrtD [Pusillimonas sp. CC-YST705]|uniref:Urea ABC transporter ATP-binding protein UrtD n=1 Tax=Mesopusillimonas faecipullorum TaxID=2755040 RepID=A0ABS8C9S7_9BURK|nr:urea ABC transporter ATP-binding protein UrtD [Mesopusillimonas faecipullorum]MCB5362785.1 urea ABC transporter ATP-binding protein UrtD [Mesopusillimonas faecipullorum]